MSSFLENSVLLAHDLGVVTYLDPIEATPVTLDGITLLKERGKVEISRRRNLVKELKANPEISSEVVMVASIFGKVARYFDEIIVKQMEVGTAGENHSWKDDAPVAVMKLNREIRKIRRNQREFLETHPHLGNTLGLIIEAGKARTSAEMAGVGKRLEAEAITSYESGEPVILVALSAYNTDPYEETPKLNRLEADIRLLLPLQGAGHQQMEELTKIIFGKVNQVFNQIKRVSESNKVYLNVKNPKGLVGTTVAEGGLTLFSSTSAESLNHSAFYLALNHIKSVEVCRQVWEKAGLGKASTEEILECLTAVYIAHEIAHQYSNLGVAIVEEWLADMPMLVVVSRLMSQKRIPEMLSEVDLRKMVATIIGESVLVAMIERKGESDFADGYPLSGRNLIYRLLDAGLVEVASNGKGIKIARGERLKRGTRKLIRESIRDMTAIFVGGKEAAEKWRDIDNVYAHQRVNLDNLTAMFVGHGPQRP